MKVRGLTKHQEQDPRLLIRDTRTLGMRIHDFLQEPRNGAIVMIVAMVTVFFFSAIADFILLICLGLFVYCYKRRIVLPFRLPKRSHLPDYNDLKPGGKNEPYQARGICFYGNDMTNNEELWFNNTDMRTHTLFFGSTGSGKTETLVSLAYNSLVEGSGFIYVDGKGDNALYAKIFSMVRSLGREDDLLLINFMTGARDIVGPQERRLSNTLNPFATGSSSMLTQLVVSLMSEASSTPDGDMWKGRAIAFVEALMKLLVYMRDQEKVLLDANTIRNYFTLERLEKMVLDKQFVRDNQAPVDITDVPALIMEPLYNYVVTLPGFNKERKGKQVSQVLEQHGFITMQLVRVFTSLADTYGHILRTKLAEVDLRDVVLNRRILVVLLPALEKSPDELGNLGKIILASLKNMMAAGLGEEVEGEHHDLVMRKPTNSRTPYMCILDEYGYYAVPGFSVVPAQARSLGFSVIFAGQDLPSFQKASKEEAASIGANTNIKIAMKMEDPMETWDFFMKTAGEAYVTKVDSFQTNSQSILNNYADTRSASAEKRARIDLLDLKDQGLGEAHIFFESKIVRAKLFYANPEPVKQLRLNHFLEVDVPPTEQLIRLEKQLHEFTEILDKGELDLKTPDASDDIQCIAKALREDKASTLIERGVTALISLQDKKAKPAVATKSAEEIPESTDELDIFSRVQLRDLTKQLVPANDLAQFSLPLLQKTQCGQKIEFIEQLFGKPDTQASRVAGELVKDMQVGTTYPPLIKEPPNETEVVAWVNDLTKTLVDIKNKNATQKEGQ